MSELEQQTSSADPIASLRRMSTTAGVAAQDYVAINNLAVVTAVLGLTTVLAFLSIVFLVFAVGAIGFGFVSLRQIRNSNGTQTGKLWVVLGILLSLAISGIVLADFYRQRQAEQTQIRLVGAAIDQFAKHLIAGNYAAAYDLLDDSFKKNWPPERFQQVLQRWQDSTDGMGAIQRMYGNGLVQFATMADGSELAHTKMIVYFKNYPDAGRRVETILRKGPDGQWRPARLVEFFETRLASNPK